MVLPRQIIRHLEVLDNIHRKSVSNRDQMHELWTSPKWAWRDKNKDLPKVRAKGPNGGPSEDPRDEGLVIYQHWLSPELLASDLPAHRDWVGQCLPKPSYPPATATSNQSLQRVINSNAEWVEMWNASKRVVEPLEPVLNESRLAVLKKKWEEEDARMKQSQSQNVVMQD